MLVFLTVATFINSISGQHHKAQVRFKAKRCLQLSAVFSPHIVPTFILKFRYKILRSVILIDSPTTVHLMG